MFSLVPQSPEPGATHKACRWFVAQDPNPSLQLPFMFQNCRINVHFSVAWSQNSTLLTAFPGKQVAVLSCQKYC